MSLFYYQNDLYPNMRMRYDNIATIYKIPSLRSPVCKKIGVNII